MKYPKEAQLNQEIADQLLANIFESCEAEPNTVPLEELESYSNYRKDKYVVRKAILTFIMVIFLLIPLLFIAPDISTLKQAASNDPTYIMGVECLVPITSVTASIDGHNVPVYEQAKRKYTIQPDLIGEMLVTIKAVNGQYIQKKIEVTEVDRKAPKATKTKIRNGKLYVYLKDNKSGIDYDDITAVDDEGKSVIPTGYNDKDGWVSFSKPDGSLYVIVPDKAGNKLQLQLKA